MRGFVLFGNEGKAFSRSGFPFGIVFLNGFMNVSPYTLDFCKRSLEQA